jgi:OOP family OmpA-OmpF porin
MKRLLIVALTLFLGSGTSQTLKPTNELALLTGMVTNFKGKALGNEIILFVNEKDRSVTKVNTDVKGRFEVLIPTNATYSMKYKNFTTDVDYTKMVVPADKEATYEVSIKIDPPREYVLQNVFFETGKAELKESSSKALNDLVEILKIKNTMFVEIQGHTDNVGDDNSNLLLSQKRAESVRNFLIKKGIAAERVIAKGYGSTMPIADNANEDGKAKNRRTGLKVLKE